MPMNRPIADIKPGDPDALRVLVAYGLLEVVEEAEDEGDVIYRMIDPEGVDRALKELGRSPPAVSERNPDSEHVWKLHELLDTAWQRKLTRLERRNAMEHLGHLELALSNAKADARLALRAMRKAQGGRDYIA